MYCCIQCTDTISGETGSFTVLEKTRPFKAASPVFPDLYELSKWLVANGWRFKPYSLFELERIK